jgi:type IV pilus assembly protein PilB
MPAADLEIAVAILSAEYNVLSAERAWKIITGSQAGTIDVVAALHQEVPEEDLLRAISDSLGIKYYDLFSQSQDYLVEEEIIEKADLAALKRYVALPMQDRRSRGVVVAVALPDMDQKTYLDRIYRQYSMVLSPAHQIQDRLASLGTTTSGAYAELGPREAPIPRTLTPPPTVVGARSAMVDLADSLLSQAVAVGASDIHLSFNAEERLNIWFRVDGLRRRQRIAIIPGRDKEVIGTLMSRCSTVDSSNFVEPADGTFSFSAAGRNIDARLAMLPEVNGPELVIRILDSRNLSTRLDDMGFHPDELALMRQVANSQQGAIVVTGPTGSGKSTTLYGLLKEVDHETKHVITVEDPVEYRLAGINQTQIRSGLGERSLTFPRALRSILRMDPDIIMVGEIRDPETAKVAMDAAITGHLVFTTVHAPSAVGVFTRLTEMGVSPYLPAEAISLIVNQRLVRRINECGRTERASHAESAWFEDLGVAVPERVMRPVGCDGCNHTGYRGRLAVVEVLVPDREIRAAVLAGGSHDSLGDVARAQGFRPILIDGAEKVAECLTSVVEVSRALVG